MQIVETQAADLAEIRRLFVEYAAALGFDLSFQDFERELAALPGEYAPPYGRLFVAKAPSQIGGCVALKRLEPNLCEMKRLYVRPEFRGMGLGRRLASQTIVAARAIGYRRMRLDTIQSMKEATALYDSLGFRPIAPYYYNPIAGALFFELDLT